MQRSWADGFAAVGRGLGEPIGRLLEGGRARVVRPLGGPGSPLLRFHPASVRPAWTGPLVAWPRPWGSGSRCSFPAPGRTCKLSSITPSAAPGSPSCSRTAPTSRRSNGARPMASSPPCSSRRTSKTGRRFDRAVVDLLRDRGIDVVVSAGYMRTARPGGARGIRRSLAERAPVAPPGLPRDERRRRRTRLRSPGDRRDRVPRRRGDGHRPRRPAGSHRGARGR